MSELSTLSDGAPPAASARDALDDFRARITALTRSLGRPPRILHMGNIANNAYNNAKLLNEQGLDCHVLCDDYYHIMGCPEWEDADFTGSVGDDFKPQWHAVDLAEFQRPRWFAQGAFLNCVDYLCAVCEGREEAAQALWLELSRDNATRRRDQRLPNSPATRALAKRRLGRLVQHRISHYLGGLTTADVVERKTRALLLRLGGPSWAGNGRLRSAARYVLILARGVSRVLFELTMAVSAVSRAVAAFAARWLAGGGIRGGDDATTRGRRRSVYDMQQDFAQIRTEPSFQAQVRRVTGHDSDPSARLRSDDFGPWRWRLPYWRKLLLHYDAVIGYATEPVVAYLLDMAYFALEHGTLREIPFQPDGRGRLTALAYRNAEHVFVTNLDCVTPARVLAGERVSFINHPFDENHGLRVEGHEALRAKLCVELDAEFLIFFPTRHDWVAHKGFADKANDRLLRAFARLRARGVRLGLLCCAWGNNVTESRELLSQLDCSDFVHWEEPMGTVRFERMARACDLVADQFKLGAFGGILFKALAVGAPVCTYLDPELLGDSFEDLPPVLNCATEEQISLALETAITAPDSLRDLGRAGRRWIERHHTSADTVTAQLRQLLPFLEARLGVMTGDGTT